MMIIGINASPRAGEQDPCPVKAVLEGAKAEALKRNLSISAGWI
jgi:multimeric flavodoxin WrbA